MSNLAFYRSRENEMRQAAAQATLAQVRERCERAAAAFQELADRAERTEHVREAERRRRGDPAPDQLAGTPIDDTLSADA